MVLLAFHKAGLAPEEFISTPYLGLCQAYNKELRDLRINVGSGASYASFRMFFSEYIILKCIEGKSHNVCPYLVYIQFGGIIAK